MDVHVHRVARQVEEQDQRGPVARRDGGAVPRFGRAQDEGIADRAAAHEHAAPATRGLRLRRALGKAAHLERALAVRHGHERARELAPPQPVQPVDRLLRRRHVDQHTIVAREPERDVGARERQQRQHLGRGPCLRRLGAQELAARGRVEEQRPHRDRRTVLAHGILHRLALSPDDPNPRTAAAVRRGLEVEARHRRDRRERLAAEAERPYADQVGGIADLAGRVARQGELRVPAAHPFAVVAHPNQGLAAVLDLDADRPGARVEGVFHELLHDGRRPLDHFPRSDLVGDLLGQDRDLGGQSRTTSEPSTQPRTPSRRRTASQSP